MVEAMDKTIENKFFKAFEPNGVVSKCIEYLRATHNLPETKDAKHDEAWQYYIEQTYPKEIIKDRKNFDSGVIGLRNNFHIPIDFGNPLTRESTLIDEVEKNLNECQTREAKERYLISLLTKFGEYGCNIAGVFTPTEQNDWTLHVRDQFRRMIGEGGNWVIENTMEECLLFFYDVMILFANRLDGMLLCYGFDLLYLQRKIGVCLIENRDKDWLGFCIGSDKLVQEYIDALPKEPQPEQTTKEKVFSTPQIPSVLNNDCASEYFAKAVKVGLMNDKFEWLETKFLLACFCKELSIKLDLGKGWNSNGEKRVCWKPFEQLFNVKNGGLRASLNDIQKTGNDPIGIEKIDALFEK